MTRPVDAFFRKCYLEARAEFLAAARDADFSVRSLTHPLQASASIPLAVDVARTGAPEPEHLLVFTSGVHGVELMAGSGCQVSLIRGGHCGKLPDRTALLMIHGANPVGAWRLTRTAENLVDLCRNFPDFGSPEAAGEEYEQVHPVLMAGEDYSAVERLMEQMGRRRFVQALMDGQYRHSDGFGFGGSGPLWANRALLRILRDEAGDASRVTIVDLHSGAGPFGVGTVVCFHSGEALALARRLFGHDLIAPRDAEAGQYRDARGHCADGYARALPGRELASIVLELGTYPLDEGLRAVIESHWAEARGDYGTARRRTVDAAMLRHHLPDDPLWRRAAVERCAEVFSQALARAPGQAQARPD